MSTPKTLGELAEALERRREGSACVVVGELSAQVRRLEGENAALRAELCGASDRAFHSTSTDRLASILEHGLLPCSEPQYFSAPAPYVMLSRAPWADLHGDRTVVLALRMPGLVWDDDEGCRWGEPISPDHIEWVMFSGQAARLAEAREAYVAAPEPADTQRTVVEVGEYAKACEERERLRAELGSTKTTSDQRFWLLDKKQRELDRAQDEAIALRAQVEALTKERDERLEEVASLRLDLAHVRAAIDRDW